MQLRIFYNWRNRQTVHNNELLRRLRYALQIDDATTVQLIAAGGCSSTTADATAWRLKEDHPEFSACEDEVVHAFMSGLIIDRRGERTENPPGKAAPANHKPDNNQLLKQLRIALSMRAEDVHATLLDGGGTLTLSEIGALFRKPDTRNYRVCGDQVLRQFITGLAKRRQTK